MISVWLTPSVEDEAYLQNIINQLAEVYETPVFPPHCTLFSYEKQNNEIVRTLIKMVGQETAPIMVYKSGLKHTDQYWKTVFIELEVHPELAHLQQSIASKIPNSTPYQFLPHISLIYKEMPNEQKENIIRKLSVKKSFKMDKLLVVKTGPIVQEWESIIEVQLYD